MPNLQLFYGYRRSTATRRKPADSVDCMAEPSRQIVWLGGDTGVAMDVNEHDVVRLSLGSAPYGVVLVADRYELHRLIIEVDRQLSRWSRPSL